MTHPHPRHFSITKGSAIPVALIEVVARILIDEFGCEVVASKTCGWIEVKEVGWPYLCLEVKSAILTTGAQVLPLPERCWRSW